MEETANNNNEKVIQRAEFDLQESNIDIQTCEKVLNNTIEEKENMQLNEFLLNKTFISESVFKAEERSGFQNYGLFSFTRDALHQKEIQIIDLMIEKGVIEIISIDLCKYEAIRDSSIKIDYSLSEYQRERLPDIYKKQLAIKHLQAEHNVLIDDKSREFTCYIKGLEIPIYSFNETISEFIYHCLNDKEFGVISCYRHYGGSNIALRFIKVNPFFHQVYNEYTLNYSPYINNINDILNRIFMMKSI